MDYLREIYRTISDWPQNVWAGIDSTPVSSCVSPGVGHLGSDKGSQIGLRGATIGAGSQTKIGRDLAGDGAFGIPCYSSVVPLA